ncbi:MAG: DUF2283 domain-containing protein [Elusimicrobiota bacterium]
MNINYDSKYDLLYIKFAEGKQEVINKNLDEDITIDVDKTGKITGIEILSASDHINLEKLFPIESKKVVSA